MSVAMRHMSVSVTDLLRAKSCIDRERGYKTYGPGEEIVDEIFIPRRQKKVVHTVSAERVVFVFINPSESLGGETFADLDYDAYDHYAMKFGDAGIQSQFFTVKYL